MTHQPTEIYSTALNLMTCTPFYRQMALGLVQQRISLALAHHHCKLYFSEDKIPLGYVSWLDLNAEQETALLKAPYNLNKLLAGDMTKQTDADRIWILDFAALTDAATIINDLRRTDLKDSIAHAVRWTDRSDQPAYCHLRGHNVRQTPYTQGTQPTPRPAILRDCYQLAPRLRQADVDEIQAASGRTPLSALVGSYYNALVCRSIVLDGRVIAMYGIGHQRNDTTRGIIWILAADKLFDFPVFLVKLGKSFVAEALQIKPHLINRADETNVETMRWLEMLGATFTQRFPNYRKSGRQFVDFEIKRNAA